MNCVVCVDKTCLDRFNRIINVLPLLYINFRTHDIQICVYYFSMAFSLEPYHGCHNVTFDLAVSFLGMHGLLAW